MTSGFDRQETIALTGITAGKLSYWDQTNLVKPTKIGNPKKPNVIYSWKQVIQLKIIDRLRENLSLQEIRKVLEFLEKENYSQNVFECNLFLVDSELFLIDKVEELGTRIILASGKNKGQIMVQTIDPFKSILENLKKEGHKNHISDFENRIKGTALEYICS